MLRDELDKCLANEIPVMMVVAVIGSTEESAVDPLDEIVNIRDEYCNEKVRNVFTENIFIISRKTLRTYLICCLFKNAFVTP